MKVICIDDEPLALDFLKRQLNKMKDVQIIGTYHHPLKRLEHILSEDVDVIFLDIQMPEINGIELAERISQDKPEIIIVFVTAYNKFAVDAFELNALDYLVKPIKMDRLRMTLDRIRKQIEMSESFIKASNTLDIKVSGSLRFEIGNGMYQQIKWRTSKSRETFLYLLQNYGKLVQKTTLMETLWNDDYDIEKTYSLLYTTIYNVRKALQPFKEHLDLQNTNDGYILNLKNVKIDLVEWEQKIASLSSLNESTVERFVRIMKLNNKPYLDEYDYIWIEPEKQRLERLWYFKAKELATFYEQTNEYHHAIHWYNIICDRLPEMEEAHFSLMKLYAQQGNYLLVNQQYEKLMSSYQAFSTQPSNHIIEWYERETRNM